MAEETSEEVEHRGTLRISYTGPVVPHWRYEFVEGDRSAIEELVHRANSIIGLLPPGDPQFRRNRDRVQRDADHEGITIEWLGIALPGEERERGGGSALALRCRAMKQVTPAVLFVCVHNAGRSQMAAGWLRHLGGNRVDVFSGGSDPAPGVNPAAVEVMAEIGIDISAEVPACWNDETLRAADVVVTMGCGDTCPVYPGRRYEDWEVPDPAGLTVVDVRPIRDEIEQRVRSLMVSLGVTPRPQRSK